MAFAEQNFDFPYWQKQTKALFGELYWNLPERKSGTIKIVGGNSQNFHTTIRIAEYLEKNFPLQKIQVLLPDVLRDKTPPVANIELAPSTDSGSFAKSPELNRAFTGTDFTILAGDLSRNSATAIALADAIKHSLNSTLDQPTPLLITRDAVDLLANSAQDVLGHSQLFLVASLAQLQKVFRAVYYPRMIMLSQPLIPVIETLHKFTLSYTSTILTFHNEQIIVASSGNISTTPIAQTNYAPFSLWSGELAARIAALNLYNPSKPFEATTAAILEN